MKVLSSYGIAVVSVSLVGNSCQGFEIAFPLSKDGFLISRSALTKFRGVSPLLGTALVSAWDVMASSTWKTSLMVWMKEVAEDVEERALRYDWDNKPVFSRFTKWFSDGCFKCPDWSFPRLSKEEWEVFRPWERCMAPSIGLEWQIEDLVAIEQAVDYLALEEEKDLDDAPSSLKEVGSSRLTRWKLSYLWVWFRFRNEHIMPWLRDETPSAPQVSLSQYISRAHSCILSPIHRLMFELLLVASAVTVLVDVILFLLSSRGSRIRRRVAQVASRSLSTPQERSISTATAERRRRQSSILRLLLGRDPPSQRQVEDMLCSLSRSAADLLWNRPFCPRGQQLFPAFYRHYKLHQSPQQHVAFETECPCCYEEYQVGAPFNRWSRLPILSDECIHGYCLQCARKDLKEVARREIYASSTTVRCPFCRVRCAFDIHSPLLRPDAYELYAKQQQQRQQARGNMWRK